MSTRRRSQGFIRLACAALGSVVGDVVAYAMTGHGPHGGAALWLSVFLPVSALASLVLHPAVLRAADAVCDQKMAEDHYGEGVAGNLTPVFWGDDVSVSVTSLARRSSVMERMLVRGLYPGLALAAVALVGSLAPMPGPVAVLVLILALIVLDAFSERVIVPRMVRAQALEDAADVARQAREVYGWEITPGSMAAIPAPVCGVRNLVCWWYAGDNRWLASSYDYGTVGHVLITRAPCGHE